MSPVFQYIWPGYPRIPNFNFVMPGDFRDPRRKLSKTERDYFMPKIEEALETVRFIDARCAFCQECNSDRVVARCGHGLHTRCLLEFYKQTENFDFGCCQACQRSSRFGDYHDVMELYRTRPPYSDLSKVGGFSSPVAKLEDLYFFKGSSPDIYTTTMAAVYLYNRNSAYFPSRSEVTHELVAHLALMFFKHPLSLQHIALPGIEELMFVYHHVRPTDKRARLQEYVARLGVPTEIIDQCDWSGVCGLTDVGTLIAVLSEFDDEPRVPEVAKDLDGYALLKLALADSEQLLGSVETAHLMREVYMRRRYVESETLGHHQSGRFDTLREEGFKSIDPIPEVLGELLDCMIDPVLFHEVYTILMVLGYGDADILERIRRAAEPHMHQRHQDEDCIILNENEIAMFVARHAFALDDEMPEVAKTYLTRREYLAFLMRRGIPFTDSEDEDARRFSEEQA
jgi:hypothetical protein